MGGRGGGEPHVSSSRPQRVSPPWSRHFRMVPSWRVGGPHSGVSSSTRTTPIRRVLGVTQDNQASGSAGALTRRCLGCVLDAAIPASPRRRHGHVLLSLVAGVPCEWLDVLPIGQFRYQTLFIVPTASLSPASTVALKLLKNLDSPLAPSSASPIHSCQSPLTGGLRCSGTCRNGRRTMRMPITTPGRGGSAPGSRRRWAFFTL